MKITVGRRLLLTFAVATLASVPVILSQPASATTTPSTTPQGIYVVLSGDKSFAESIIDASEHSPEYCAKVIALRPAWTNMPN